MKNKLAALIFNLIGLNANTIPNVIKKKPKNIPFCVVFIILKMF